MRVVTGPAHENRIAKMERGKIRRGACSKQTELKGAENSNMKRINNDFVSAYQKTAS